MRWIVALVFLVPACGIDEPDFWAFSSGTATVTGSSGTVTRGGFTGVAIWTSDSPVDELDAVHVTFDRVEFTRGGERVVLLDRPSRMNLLELQNGVRRLLAEGEAAPGTYASLRIRVAPEGAVERRGAVEPLRLAPGAPDTFVFDGPFRFRPDEVMELQLDFNVRLSVWEAGGAWWLAPHGTLHDPRLAGAVEGTALPAGTRVSAQVDGREAASTTSRADGSFRLFPLRDGRYDVVASRAGYEADVVRGVRVDRAATTHGVHFLLGARTAGGSLRGTYAGGGQTVRLLRDGVMIGVAGIDPATGAFTFPSVPPDELSLEFWSAGAPAGTSTTVFVEPATELRVRFE